MRKGALAGLVAVWVAVCGCSPAARGYLAGRLDDAGDCVEASGGVGIPAYARVRVTDYAVVGLGLAFSNRTGWCGRHGALDDSDWATVLQVAIPLLGNSEINFFGPDVHGAWRSQDYRTDRTCALEVGEHPTYEAVPEPRGARGPAPTVLAWRRREAPPIGRLTVRRSRVILADGKSLVPFLPITVP